MHEILEYIYDLLPSNKKQRSNGWEYFNAPCCILTENQDTKKRGNALFSEDSFTYNCFNCHYQTGFTLGQYLSKKCEQLLRLSGASDEQIKTLKKMKKHLKRKLFIDQEILEKFLRCMNQLINLLKKKLIHQH